MSIETLVIEIDDDIARLQQACALVAGSQRRATALSTKKPALRKLSAAARKKMADAQRKRWAAVKEGTVNAAAAKPEKKAARAKKRRMSAEAKKRLAETQKKRWAAIFAAKEASEKVPVKKVV